VSGALQYAPKAFPVNYYDLECGDGPWLVLGTDS